ncbi:MAG: ABC transporter permease [Victivallales bacterium]
MENNGTYPSLHKRLFGVWYRHYAVYSKNLYSNAFPPFMEPLIFLAAIGIGIGKFINGQVEGLSYMEFLATGLLMTSAMYTSAFECSYGTFIRLEFDKVYDGMLAAPITADNLIVGEILWAGSKGFFFSFAVLVVMAAFGVITSPFAVFTPLVGFATGIIFAVLSLLITSYIKTINHFNFYFTGLLSPMFFFSGVVFSVDELPVYLRPVAEALPLTHPVRIVRLICTERMSAIIIWDLAYIALFTVIVGCLATSRLRKRLVN